MKFKLVFLDKELIESVGKSELIVNWVTLNGSYPFSYLKFEKRDGEIVRINRTKFSKIIIEVL